MPKTASSTPRGALPGRKPGIFVRWERCRTASEMAPSRRSGGTSTRTLSALRGAGVTVTFIEASIGGQAFRTGRETQLVGKEGVEPSRPLRDTGS